MTAQPSVCAICLTADRQKFTSRAIRLFNRQTYPNRWMLLYDTGEKEYVLDSISAEDRRRIVVVRDPGRRGMKIGALRNEANSLAARADVIAHWDSDDWSNARRLEVQMPLWEIGCGFANMLFWDSRAEGKAWEYTYQRPGKVLGTSLLYARDIWKAHPFPEDKADGEENRWPTDRGVYQLNGVSPEMMMIAEYHGGNTGSYGKSEGTNTPAIFDQTAAQLIHNPQWKRRPDFDAQVQNIMENA